MSIKNVPTLVCDGCGAVIDMDFYIRVHPGDQEILQRDPSRSPERDFCCEACKEWWYAEFPTDGPWGPAWEERAWWWQQRQNGEHTSIRTAHTEMPLVDTHANFVHPETVRVDGEAS
jgi:hypothetical protein